MPSKPRERARAGDGTVFELPSGKWRAEISIGPRGHRKRIARQADTESGALEALQRLRAENIDTTSFAGSAPTVDEAIKVWLAETKPRIRAKSYATYELTLRLHVVEESPGLANMRIDRVKPKHVRDLFAALERKKAGARVRELVYLRLRSVFARWIGQGVLRNPVEKGHRPRQERRTMTTWTQEQARAFLAATESNWLAVLFRIALSVGMRRGELLGLRWVDVDLKNKRIHVQHTLTDDGELAEPKTDGSRRTIELPSRAAAALGAQREMLLAKGLRVSPWVFPDESGGSYLPRRLTREFALAIGAANENRDENERIPTIRFHDLRHTAATLRLQSGDNPKVVSEMLGHASIEITMDLYSHVAPSLQRESADRFDAIL